jgi:hypothetical protein
MPKPWTANDFLSLAYLLRSFLEEKQSPHLVSGWLINKMLLAKENLEEIFVFLSASPLYR